MLFPFQLDVPMSRWPWMNWVLLGLIFVAFLVQLEAPDFTDRFVLGIAEFEGFEHVEEHWLSLLVHMFLHADITHLAGNLWILWVFGNAICAKVGNAWYAPIFVGFGALTAIVEPYGLGASGAINGIIGMTLMLYPVNDVTMFYWIFFRFGTFTVRSYWVVVFYMAFDILGLVLGGTEVAYLTHISGCAAGLILALVLLKTGALEANDQEWTLLDLFSRSSKTRGGEERGTPTAAHAGNAAVRLHVQLPNGARKHLAVSEFLRHEQQGKSVNQFRVSEDGETWTTFGAWRAARKP